MRIDGGVVGRPSWYDLLAPVSKRNRFMRQLHRLKLTVLVQLLRTAPATRLNLRSLCRGKW